MNGAQRSTRFIYAQVYMSLSLYMYIYIYAFMYACLALHDNHINIHTSVLYSWFVACNHLVTA